MLLLAEFEKTELGMSLRVSGAMKPMATDPRITNQTAKHNPMDLRRSIPCFASMHEGRATWNSAVSKFPVQRIIGIVTAVEMFGSRIAD